MILNGDFSATEGAVFHERSNCNCGYVLLGLLIEKACGLSYRDYVRQQIFAPAGMLHSANTRDGVWEPLRAIHRLLLAA